MNNTALQKLKGKVYFTVGELADILNIKLESARVISSRYVKRGIFVRLKKNFYILSQDWENFLKEDYLKTSNFLQVPSYVSFMTALSFYDVTTQVQRNFFESASLKRSVKFSIKGAIFNFYKLKKELYFDFIKKGEIFIATKEKAFADSVYLYSFGKYKLDFNSLDLDKLDKSKLKGILKIFPQKTKNIIKKLCRI